MMAPAKTMSVNANTSASSTSVTNISDRDRLCARKAQNMRSQHSRK